MVGIEPTPGIARARLAGLQPAGGPSPASLVDAEKVTAWKAARQEPSRVAWRPAMPEDSQVGPLQGWGPRYRGGSGLDVRRS